MSSVKRAAGSVVHGTARVLDAIFSGVIAILGTIVILTEALRRSFLQLLLAGGCLLLFLLLNPFGILLLFQPGMLIFLFVIFVVPLLGRTFISFLQYGEYVITEYLYDYADYLKKGRNRAFRSFGEYGRKYIRMEEEKYQEAQRRRREAEQKFWEERFQTWYQQGGQYRSYGSYTGQGQSGPFVNPYEDFVDRYEKAAKVLGVPNETDEYQVKLAYRKLAKQLHPDVNPSADATQRFQELSDAYDFMSKENIERYRSIKKGSS